MPKIIIKEYDKTKAVTGAYENFSVVVPGFVKERTYDATAKAYKYGGKKVCSVSSGVDDTGESVFDENGIYECNSASEFAEVIGPVDYQAPQTIKYATLTKLGESGGSEVYKGALDPAQAQQYAGSIYVISDQEAGTDEGYCVIEKNKWNITPALTKNFRCVLASVDQLKANQNLIVIKPGNEGRNEVANVNHCGNQIAYQLLKLGYTVLYKKLVVATESSTIAELSKPAYWEALKDKSNYDFRYVLSGLLQDSTGTGNESYTVAKQLKALAEFSNISTTSDNGRGDCIALCDVSESDYSAANSQQINISSITAAANQIGKSKYAAILAPYVVYESSADGYNNTKLPASFHYLACAAKARENNFAEWYAVAGYTRGVSDYNISSVGCKLGEAAIDALQPRAKSTDAGALEEAVNLIVKIKNQYFLWGNRTAYELDEELKASHFLNIRNLCCTLKKTIYSACKQFTFDPNSDLLWVNFCSAITPTLDRMKADQGISDYELIKVETGKKALLTAKVRIVPIEAVEEFEIGISLEDSLSGSVEFTD